MNFVSHQTNFCFFFLLSAAVGPVCRLFCHYFVSTESLSSIFFHCILFSMIPGRIFATLLLLHNVDMFIQCNNAMKKMFRQTNHTKILLLSLLILFIFIQHSMLFHRNCFWNSLHILIVCSTKGCNQVAIFLFLFEWFFYSFCSFSLNSFVVRIMH